MTLIKILIVDDEKDILTILKSALEVHGGFLVKCVTSGEEALKEAPLFQPDLILLDILMPVMDGMATFKALQSIPSVAQVPVVIITAFADPEKVKTLLKSGIVDVIVKPFDPWTLPGKIQSILDRYQREKRNLGK